MQFSSARKSPSLLSVISDPFTVMKKKKIEKFEDLRVWELSHELNLEIYKSSRQFPKQEIYGLTSQIRRASSSVPANIVEGYYRKSKKEFIQFLFIARASAGEVTYSLILCRDLKYINSEKYEYLRNEYEKLIASITALINSLSK